MPAAAIKLTAFTELNISAVSSLLEESVDEGYLFIQKTIADWENGANRFAKPGEKLWGLFAENELIGIGGLNRDPYVGATNIGRVRHLYILKSHRRKGYATMLLLHIIAEAKPHFTLLRLFTDQETAGQFYETLGFEKISGPKVSHQLRLGTSATARVI
jgi:GNAT superfamily N-acetyltransferase